MDRDDRVVLLDGGTGQELLARADGAATPLWSAQVMIDQPELVVDVHRSFIDAGAQVVTTNAYSATRCRLAPHGREDDYERLQRLAGELAATARGDRDDVRIAGCLSPFRWTYRPELAPPFDELWPTYAESAALQAPYVDLVLCETMGSIDEARAAAIGAATCARPVWVSWTLRHDDTATLPSGEPLAAAVAAVESLRDAGDALVEAYLVNCASPEAITSAVDVLVASTDVAVGGYANGFHPVTSSYDTNSVTTEIGRRDDVGPMSYATTVEGWVEAGATIVGGCCEIGPAHVAELAHRLGRTTAA
jgi:S-methylmethionine-dependent homocysteine/selenocysteine methylase